MMQKRLFEMTIVLIVFLAVSMAAYAQLPPASAVLPAGFKVETERNLGGAMIIEAKKPNENFPKPHMDQGIGLHINWTKQPMATQVLDMLAKQPEEPAGRSPGSATREEPCGIQRYRDGVLICRKVIIPWIGGGSGPDLVTWRLSWTGKGPGGLINIEVNNFYGSKETAMSWIDSIIPKVSNPK
jgi:hypothetical protein